MSDASDLTVVWIEKAEAETREDARRAVAEGARKRGLKLHLPTQKRGTPTLVNTQVARQVEEDLERTREALAALDVEEAEQALTRAEARLQAHPELPQAAWLRAEVKRAWAARWARLAPIDEPRATAALREAEAIGGSRILGIGDVPVSPPPKFSAVLTLVGGQGRALVLHVDGTEISASSSSNGTHHYSVNVPAADHQVVVSADGETAYASWVKIDEPAPGSSVATISIPIGDGDPCSAAAFADVKRDGMTVRSASVTCDRWMAAVPTAHRDAVLVALCEKSLCGPLLEWRAAKELTVAERPAESRKWPAWGTWTALGVGAVATTALTLIATGAFEARRTDSRFVAGGARIE